MQEELDRLGQGVSEEEMVKARNGLELGLYEGFKDAEGLAEALGHHETNYDDFALAFAGTERWAEVTAADLARVAAEVFRLNNRTLGVVVPPRA